MLTRRSLAIVGLGRFLIGRQESAERTNQRRSGGFERSDAELPGEESRMGMRNEVDARTSGKDEEFCVAENQGEACSDPAGSRRNCCAGRVAMNESEGAQENAVVGSSDVELRDSTA